MQLLFCFDYIFAVCGLLWSVQPPSTSVSSLALGQSHDCPSSSLSYFSLYWTWLIPSIRGGSSLTALLCLPLWAFPSDGWISIRPSAKRSMSITFVLIFLGRQRPRPPVGLSFWTFFNRSPLRSTWPCHLSRRVRSTFARSSSCTLSKRSCELTWSLEMAPHIQRIKARSLRCMWCKSDKVGGQGFTCKEHGTPDTRNEREAHEDGQ